MVSKLQLLLRLKGSVPTALSTTLQRLLLPGELSYLSFRSFCMQLTALQRLRLLGRGQRLAATLASTAEKPGR